VGGGGGGGWDEGGDAKGAPNRTPYYLVGKRGLCHRGSAVFGQRIKRRDWDPDTMELWDIGKDTWLGKEKLS